MDGMILLIETHSAGLKVVAEGADLRIRGPRRAGEIAQRLIANKAAVLEALAFQPDSAANGATTLADLAVPDAIGSNPSAWDGTVPELPVARPGCVVEWAFRSEKFGWIQRRIDIADLAEDVLTDSVTMHAQRYPGC